MKKLLIILLCSLQGVLLFGTGRIDAPPSAAEQEQNPLSDTGNSSSDTDPVELYGAGDYEKAAEMFLLNPGRGGRRVRNYYNAARSLHQDYIENGSVESLQRAVEGYYRTLDLEPAHTDALRNLELARRELEKELPGSPEKEDTGSQQNSQDESGEQGQNSPQGADGQSGSSRQEMLNDLADRQQQLADSPGDGDSMEKQSELSDQTQQASEGSESENGTLQQAVEKQQEALERMARGDDEGAAEAQSEAAGLLRQAAEESTENSGEDGSGQDDDALPQDLQSLLNREQARNRDQRDPEQVINVERNW